MDNVIGHTADCRSEVMTLFLSTHARNHKQHGGVSINKSAERVLLNDHRHGHILGIKIELLRTN